MNNPEVIIAWATKKRHIYINGELLCNTKHKNYSGYSNGQYNSTTIFGLPDYKKLNDDVDYNFRGGHHSDGIIEYKPLDQQKYKIIERSICNKCLKKYKKLFEKS